MAVSLVDSSALEVGESSKTLGLECLDAATNLCKLLLGPSIRQIRQRLGAQCVDGGSKLPHLTCSTKHEAPSKQHRPRLERTFDTLLQAYDIG
jgi:hypothetical protein